MPELTRAQKRLVDIVQSHDCLIYEVERGDGNPNYYLYDCGSYSLPFKKREKLKPKTRKVSDEAFVDLYAAGIFGLDESHTEEKRGLTYYYFRFNRHVLQDYLEKPAET